MKIPAELLLYRSIVFWGFFALLLVIELIRPYRASTVPKIRRLVTNISLTLFNSVILSVLFAAAIVKTAQHANAAGIGVLNYLGIPGWQKLVLTVVFMDFMLYVWHLLNHEMPFLWRFHRVHHSDLNMDVSTATRFHIGELSISAVIKIGLVYFLGADVLGIVVFEGLLVMTAQFQHSSMKISPAFEKIYWTLFVPPSMHRIHHSVRIRERDTNYGTIFSVWDRMLGTLLKDVRQEAIIIGVGPYRDFGRLRLVNLLAMPFSRPIK